MINCTNNFEPGKNIFDVWTSHLEDKERKRQHWVKGHYTFKNRFALA